MVEDTRKTLHTDTYRTLNQPEPVEVKETLSSLPLVIKTERPQTVASIDERWRIDDEWWRREPISRLYYSIRLDSGYRLVLFKDLFNNHWYQQSC